MDALANKTHAIYEAAVISAEEDGKHWASDETKFRLALANAVEQVLIAPPIDKADTHEIIRRIHFALVNKYVNPFN